MCHEVASEFFATNSSDPPHCTVNGRFDAFCTIWMHSGPFGCLTKLGHNECTQSTPLDPKLMRSYDLGAFGTVWLCYQTRAKRAELVQKFVPRSYVGIFRNECTRSTPLDPKLTFCCVRTIWVHSGQFDSLTKLGAKQAELVQKFMPRSRV